MKVLTEIKNDFLKLKIAHAEGYTIQAWRPQQQRWQDLKRPLWSEKTQYRIKPGALGMMGEQVSELKNKTPRLWVYAGVFIFGALLGGFTVWALQW